MVKTSDNQTWSSADGGKTWTLPRRVNTPVILKERILSPRMKAQKRRSHPTPSLGHPRLA